MKKSEYRCSCCNQLRNDGDINYISWTSEGDDNVGICTTCNTDMKTFGYEHVLEFKISTGDYDD